MINSLKNIFLILVSLFLFSCAGTNTSSNKSEKPKSTYPPTSVQNYLQTLSGVRVVGNKVNVAPGEALLIVNGSPMSYQTLVSTTPVYSIKSARVSRSQTDLKEYTNSLNYTAIILLKQSKVLAKHQRNQAHGILMLFDL